MWNEIRPETEPDRELQIGKITLSLQRTAEALTYGTRSDFSDELVRTVRGLSYAALRPATPDLPVVLQPEHPVSILPGARVTYVVGVPVWIQLAAKAGNKTLHVLLDMASRTLPRTWFGVPDNGESAYFVLFPPDKPFAGSLDYLTTKIVVKNSSPDPLWFDRFLFRINRLDVAVDGERIITNSLSVTFKGTEQLSQIEIGKLKNSDGKELKPLTPRRVNGNTDFIRKSFLLLRDLTG